MKDVLSVIKSRRSIRKYKSEQIKKEELDIILQSAIYAPTGHNDQPWYFTVIRNKELIDKINKVSLEEMSKSKEAWIAKLASKRKSIFYDAPTIVVVSGKDDTYSPLTDCSAAIQNMLLAAESLDIGSVWIGLTSHYFETEKNYREILGIPEGYTAFYTVALGYKEDMEICKEAPPRNLDVIKFID